MSGSLAVRGDNERAPCVLVRDEIAKGTPDIVISEIECSDIIEPGERCLPIARREDPAAAVEDARLFEQHWWVERRHVVVRIVRRVPQAIALEGCRMDEKHVGL